MKTIKVGEIFQSIDGEINYYHQGRQTIFLRLAGCNFDGVFCQPCAYCDTKEYQDADSGTEITIQELANKLSQFDSENLTITGGEPLMQWGSIVNFLNLEQSKQWKNISIETNGSLPLPNYRSLIGRPLSFVIDVKLTRPQFSKMNKGNWKKALSWDYFKMVVNENNFTTAVAIYKIIKKTNYHKVNIAFSPEYYGGMEAYKKSAQQLITSLQESGINDAIINLQLHKIIGAK